MEENRIKSTYYPREIIEYLEKRGSLTPEDLEKDWEYDRLSAVTILADLKQLGVIVPEEVNVGGRKIPIASYRLTEAGRKMKNSLLPRTIILTVFPVISQIISEEFNNLIEVFQAKGIELEELEEIIESNSLELEKIINKERLEILKDLSPEDLRQLAREIKEIKKP